VDVQGAATIRAASKEDSELEKVLVTVFLAPPSLKILEERLLKRGGDDPGTIQKRLSVARHEIAQWRHFGYLIISGSIREDLHRMEAILDAEKMRQCRAQLPLYD
jgi:guanylate kinase